MTLQQRVWNYCRDRGLLSPGDTVVIGVSGGPDSLCLLDLLSGLAPRHHLTLHVAHLNHALRPEADEEAQFVREQSEKRGLAFRTATADTRAWATGHKQSVEEAARNLRYAFLGAVAKGLGARRVAVAHTQDDQAETVLMHFLRGSGLAGLAGMEAKRVMPFDGQPSAAIEEPPEPIQLIRPLLDVTRAEVMAYCAEVGLAPKFDPSNLDPAYYRNRLRHALLPELETYNPNIRAVLSRSAEVLRGDFDWQSQAAEELWQATALPFEAAGLAAFHRDRWLLLTDAQQRTLLRLAARRLLGGLRDVGYRPIAAAARFSRKAVPGRSCQVTGGLSLVILAEQVCLVTDAFRLQRADSQLPLVQPDDGLAAGWRLDTSLVPAAEWREPGQPNASRWTVFVDADRLASALTLRTRRPGDRFVPLGMAGHHMKLSDFMVNEKIPVAWRNRWPLVVTGDVIVWVAGLRLDERFRVRADTQRVLRLELVGPESVEDK